MSKNREFKIELVKKAFEYKFLKKYQEAIELLKKALEYEEDGYDDIEIYSFMGQLYLLMQNQDKALEAFNKTLSIKANHIFSLQKCFEIYYDKNEINKALETADKLCKSDRSPVSYYYYIKALIKLNKKEEALEIFNSLDEAIKLDSDLLYLIATINGSKRKMMLERIVQIDEYNKEANLDLAKMEYEAKNYNKVIKYCLNLDDDTPLANYYLAMIEASKNRYSKAIDLFVKAIKFDNNEHDFYFDLAKTYIDVAWLSEALDAVKKSINYSFIHNKHDNIDEKYFLMAWILIKQNKFSQALLNLSSIKKESPLYSKAQVLEQTINLKNVNLASAKSVLEKYYNEEKDNPILLDTLAIVYKELKLYKKAIEIYNQALLKYPDSIYYNLEIIDLLIDEKRYSEALELIDKFSKNCTNCPNIYNSLARIFYRLKNLDEALRCINLYLNLDKNTAESFYFKGLILNDLNKFQEAKNSIYNAIKLNPNKAKYYSQMSRSYFNLNELESALLYIKEAIELDNNEISYKKQAYDIALAIGNKTQILMYENQLKRSEKILRLSR